MCFQKFLLELFSFLLFLLSLVCLIWDVQLFLYYFLISICPCPFFLPFFVLCFLFSVLCSLFSILWSFVPLFFRSSQLSVMQLSAPLLQPCDVIVFFGPFFRFSIVAFHFYLYVCADFDVSILIYFGIHSGRQHWHLLCLVGRCSSFLFGSLFGYIKHVTLPSAT